MQQICHNKHVFLSISFYLQDFIKAFDFVNWDALLYKLKQKGVCGNFLNVLKNMFEKATNKVKWQGLLSNSFQCPYGVLQGGIISPKLFNEYLSDIGNTLSSEAGVYLDELLFYYLLYADDLVLFSETEIGLQTQLNMLQQYCQKWHLILSLPKTKIMIFNKRNYIPQIYFDNQLLEFVSQFKYLGIIFDSNKKQILHSTPSYLADQANRGLSCSLKMY